MGASVDALYHYQTAEQRRKAMKEKIIKEKKALPPVTIAISIFIIAGVALNVYQFNSNNSLRNELYTLEAEIENFKNEGDTLNSKLVTKRAEMTALSSQLEELKATISSLESDNKSLSENLEELKAAKENLEESSADIGLTDDEIFNSIWEELEKEHPEWFASPEPSATNQGNYEHVGTPSTGDMGDYVFGQGGDSGVAPGIVY